MTLLYSLLIIKGVAQRIQTASQRAVSYLEGRVATLSDDYALAIVSYSLALAKSGSAGAAFSRLNSDAIIKGIIAI